MTTDIHRITERKPVDQMSDREVIAEILSLLRDLDATLAGAITAWGAGGVRGMRKALTNGRD